MRPKISDDTVEAVNSIVSEHTEIPPGHLTFDQRVERVCNVVEELEDELPSGRVNR